MMDLAKSKLLRVDLGEEAENLSRMKMLMRTSSVAFTRANAVPANVFYIMQGGGERTARGRPVSFLLRHLIGY